jgi:hypothetical protein
MSIWAIQYDDSMGPEGKLICVGTRDSCEAMAKQYEEEFAESEGRDAEPLAFEQRKFTLHAKSTWLADGHNGQYMLTEWEA